MCLLTIYERMATQFYRHVDALLFDVSCIHTNALLFNDPSSPIVAQAHNLVTSLRNRIQGTSLNTVWSGKCISKHLVL
jgi:hypothetical protein